jgi:maltose-binding protein MalE
MEFKVGDKVLVENLNYTGDGSEVYVNSDMLNYIGKQYFISGVKYRYDKWIYRLGTRHSIGRWWFVSKWLLPAEGRVDRY